MLLQCIRSAWESVDLHVHACVVLTVIVFAPISIRGVVAGKATGCSRHLSGSHRPQECHAVGQVMTFNHTPQHCGLGAIAACTVRQHSFLLALRSCVR